jgi:hypothetical protein
MSNQITHIICIKNLACCCVSFACNPYEALILLVSLSLLALVRKGPSLNRIILLLGLSVLAVKGCNSYWLPLGVKYVSRIYHTKLQWHQI